MLMGPPTARFFAAVAYMRRGFNRPSDASRNLGIRRSRLDCPI
jgi:hypothetical protein